MIYPVQYLVRQQILAAANYDFTAEVQLGVRFVADPRITFHNPSATTSTFRVIYTIAKSATFSDSYTVLTETVTLGNMYEYQPSGPLVQTSDYVTHSVRMTNGDAATQWLYCLITGWTDTKLTLPATVYAIGADV